MRRPTSVSCIVAASALSLLGCAGEQPVEPSAAVAARAARTLATPSGAVAVAISENRIDIRWQDNSSDETGFQVLRSTSGASGDFALLATTGVNALAYSDVGLARGTQYCYAIRAVRKSGNRAVYSASSNTTCTSTPPVLLAPSNAKAVAVSSSQVELTWRDNSGAETRFEISGIYSDVYGTYGIQATAPANVTDYSFPSLAPARAYCFQVRAVAILATGDGGFHEYYSAFSNTACARTPPGPAPPAIGAAAVPSGSTAVTVSWISAGDVGDSTRIDRSIDGGAMWEVAGRLSHSYSGAFTDAPLPSERSVCYRVVAYNATGAAEPSNTACTTPPAAPTAVTLPQDRFVVELTWRDDSAVEDGYEVRYPYRQCGNDGNGSWYCFDDELIEVLPANATSYRLSAYPSSADLVSVRAMKHGGYSDAAVASYAAAP